MTNTLEISKLSGGYGVTRVVREVSLSVGRGQILALIGKNGMGKTTLLKLILGLLPAADGRVRIGDADVTGWRPNNIVSKSVSYVPQEQPLFQDLSVHENLRLGALGLSRSDFERRKQEMVGHFPFLERRMDQRAGTLSGGEQKMLLLARSLLPRPQLVLIDEVTEGVQPSVISRMATILNDVRKSTGLSVLLIEQNIDFAFSLADHYCVLNSGILAEEGDPNAPSARQRVESYFTL